MNIDARTILKQLEQLPGTDVRIDDEGTLRIVVGGQPRIWQVLARSSGYPRDVREAVFQGRARNPSAPLAFVAPSISNASRKWLESEGVGYVDLNGNIFLSQDTVYLFRESGGPRQPGSRNEDSPDIFKGQASAVVHTLLVAPSEGWHITALAQASGVAPATALKVCLELEKHQWIERKGKGPKSIRRVTEPGSILNAWAQQHRLGSYKAHRLFRWEKSLSILVHRLGTLVEAQGLPWALTLDLAALYRAPFITGASEAAILVPLGTDIDLIQREAGLEQADEGSNLILFESKKSSPFLHRNQEDGLWLASDIQLYLDLQASARRGPEQARHLRNERIGF